MDKTRLRTSLLLRLFESTSYLVCFVLFIVLMLDVWDKFSKKMTNMGVVFQEKDVELKELPCLTICPWPAFRERNFSFSTETFKDRTFNQNEILWESLMPNFSDPSLYQIEEIKSVNLGRCYLVRYLKKLSSTTDKVFVTVQKQMDLTGFRKFIYT